jgi:hypothetical protein
VISAIRNVVDQFLTLGTQQQPKAGTTGGIFGSTTAQSAQPATGGIFGSTTAQSSQPATGGLFGKLLIEFPIVLNL